MISLMSLHGRLWPLLLLVFVVPLAGCANWNEDAGVDNHWRAETAPEWTPGVSTADDVMAALGPPSQIINLS